ncbi:BID domain-containing T4SS effector [Bartonella doshiae]|uniref:BID domain-containing T4SS effector n=1 Tax=Bartonella doshiae TaxID=33044 RepID=UPI001ABAAECF|nr:BID domain-containing T4SS effector [Bartonella doshiae]
MKKNEPSPSTSKIPEDLYAKPSPRLRRNPSQLQSVHTISEQQKSKESIYDVPRSFKGPAYPHQAVHATREQQKSESIYDVPRSFKGPAYPHQAVHATREQQKSENIYDVPKSNQNPYQNLRVIYATLDRKTLEEGVYDIPRSARRNLAQSSQTIYAKLRYPTPEENIYNMPRSARNSALRSQAVYAKPKYPTPEPEEGIYEAPDFNRSRFSSIEPVSSQETTSSLSSQEVFNRLKNRTEIQFCMAKVRYWCGLIYNKPNILQSKMEDILKNPHEETQLAEQIKTDPKSIHKFRGYKICGQKTSTRVIAENSVMSLYQSFKEFETAVNATLNDIILEHQTQQERATVSRTHTRHVHRNFQQTREERRRQLQQEHPHRNRSQRAATFAL